MFCNTCAFIDHRTHDIVDLIENQERLVSTKRKLHEILENLDISYKQSARFLGSSKEVEESFNSMIDPYNDNIVEITKDIILEALDLAEKETNEVKYLFENQKTELCEQTKHFERVLKDLGDSQSIVRDSLSASSLQFGNLLSDGKVEKLEEKLSEGLRLTLAFIKQRDISTYHHEIQQARDNLRKDVLELLRQFLKSFMFKQISKFEISLNSSSSGFKEFPWHRGSLENSQVTSTQYEFCLAVLKDGEFKLYSYENIAAAEMAKSKTGASSQFFKFIPGEHNIVHFTSKKSFVAEKFSQKNALATCSSEEVVAHYYLYNPLPFIIFCRYSNGNWITNYETLSNNPHDFQLCDSKLYPEKPYSFALQQDCFETMISVVIACISKDSLYLYSIQRIEEFDFGKRPINCKKMKSNEHKGKFGCGFLPFCYRERCIRLINWCLECQILEVLKIATEEKQNALPGQSLSHVDTEIVLQFNFAPGIRSITTFKAGLIIMTKDWKLYTCDDILSTKMGYMYQTKK